MPMNASQPNRPPIAGWVYVMDNDAFPGAVKVGCTTRTPAERAAELSRGSGVPLPFRVAGSRAVPDCVAVERQVHRMLADVRVSKDREFFHCQPARALEVINAVADACPVQRQAKPLRPFPRQASAAMRTTPFKVQEGQWRRYRRRGAWWRTPGAIRLGIGLACAAVSLAMAWLHPDVSALPPGPVRATLRLLGGRI